MVSALVDDSDEQVEMERMTSETAGTSAAKYAWGGSDLRRGLRDGVLSSTSASSLVLRRASRSA